jgi:hypothetical protein
MSSPIKAFYLKCVSNAKELVEFFEVSGIAKVSSVVITQCKSVILADKKVILAYVCVDYWHDTETAYNFIKLIVRDQPFDTRLFHLDAEIRAVEIKDPENCAERIYGHNEHSLICWEEAIDEYNCNNYVITIKQDLIDEDFGGYVTQEETIQNDLFSDKETNFGDEYDYYSKEIEYTRGWDSICDMV